MIKAKEVSIRNIIVFLMLSLAVTAGYYLTRSRLTTAKSVPVFMGEEVIVHKGGKAVTAVRGVTTVRAEKAVGAVTAVKAETAPVPMLKTATPSPIVPPAVTFRVLPVYPSTALEKGLEGTVLLSVYVGLSGEPEKIDTKTSSGVAELDESAVKAVSQWRFLPATQGGTALASWFEVPVRFELK